MTAAALDAKTAARRLGGELSGGEILCPGPHHSDQDRSLSVKFRDTAPDGFLVHSFAGDDPIECRDYVRRKLGLSPFEPRKKKNGGAAPWTLISVHVYRDENNAPYLRVRRYLDDCGRKQYPQSKWDGAQWIKGAPTGPKVPYRLPELLAAPASATVYVTEGEKCADGLAKLGFVATTNSEGAEKWATDLNGYFKDRNVVIVGDNDEPGRKHVRQVATNLHGVAGAVRVLNLAEHWPGEPMPIGDDVADWIERHDRAGSRLAALAKEAPLWEPGAEPADSTGSDDALIAELAALSKLAYARRRKEAAKVLGISVGDLDRIVREARGEDTDKAPPAPSLLYEHWHVEPAAEEIEGEILLRALVETLGRYVVMDGPLATACALWVVMTWVHEKAVYSPILLVNSPLPSSGKTTLLKVISFLARNGLSSVSITGAALFRSIEKWGPTIAIDEADTVFLNNDDLKDVVNSGWTRGDCIIRCDPDTHDPRVYPTFCPKAIGMIGRKLPPATLSRCLMIPMRRKRPDEHADDFDHVDNGNLARLRSQLLRWATDNAEALATAKPEIPPGLHNRARMNWQILLAIGERCHAKKGAWDAVKAVEEINATTDPELAAQLLSDIRDAFNRHNKHLPVKDHRLPTKELLHDLHSDEEGPWLSFGKGGKPITDRQLARLMKEFRRGKGIQSRNIRLVVGHTEMQVKGYERADFEEDFSAYLDAPHSSRAAETPFPSAPPSQTSIFNDLEQKTSVPETPAGTDKNEVNQLKTNNCNVGTDKNVDLAATEEKASVDVADPCASSMATFGRCAQCHGLAADAPLATGDGYPVGGVYLHRECRKFWLAHHRVGLERLGSAPVADR